MGGGQSDVGVPVEGSPRSFEHVPKRVSGRDRWDVSGNGRDVTAKLKKEADVPLRGRVFYRENLPPPSSTKQKAQSKSEGSSQATNGQEKKVNDRKTVSTPGSEIWGSKKVIFSDPQKQSNFSS